MGNTQYKFSVSDSYIICGVATPVTHTQAEVVDGIEIQHDRTHAHATTQFAGASTRLYTVSKALPPQSG